MRAIATLHKANGEQLLRKEASIAPANESERQQVTVELLHRYYGDVNRRMEFRLTKVGDAYRESTNGLTVYFA